VGVAGGRGRRSGLWHIVWVLIKNTPLREALEVCGLAALTMLRGVHSDRARELRVGADRGVDRHAAAGGADRSAHCPVHGGLPANLLFPIAVYGIVCWKLNPDIFLSPLMILGTQWYILFNVIAGASAIPAEMRYVAANFRVAGWLWWRKVRCRQFCRST